MSTTSLASAEVCLHYTIHYTMLTLSFTCCFSFSANMRLSSLSLQVDASSSSRSAFSWACLAIVSSLSVLLRTMMSSLCDSSSIRWFSYKVLKHHLTTIIATIDLEEHVLLLETILKWEALSKHFRTSDSSPIWSRWKNYKNQWWQWQGWEMCRNLGH